MLLITEGWEQRNLLTPGKPQQPEDLTRELGKAG